MPSIPSSTPLTPSSTGDLTPCTPTTPTRPNDAYLYGVGILAALAIGVCVFFAYNTYQPKNSLHNEKQDQQPKIRPML